MPKPSERKSETGRLADFAQALLKPGSATPSGVINPDGRPATKRFNVYRNNVIVSLIETLKARYPVVEKLVGDKFFQGMAREYVLAHPPSSPLITAYGKSFPNFIDAFPPAQSVPYLSDVARLENARLLAYHAADMPPLDSAQLGQVPPEQLEKLKFHMHPALNLIYSQYAIFSIWQANMDNTTLDLALNTSEPVLIHRPALGVDVYKIAPEFYQLFSSLQNGTTLGAAAQAAISLNSKFDLAEALTYAISTGIFIHFTLN